MTLTVKDGLDDTKSLDVEGVSPHPTAHVVREGAEVIGTLAENAGVVIGAVTATLACELPAGTAAIGKLSANALDEAINIGNIDTVTHVLDFEKIAGLTKGQGLMAGSLPVAIADDQSIVTVKGGAISISIAMHHLAIVDDEFDNYHVGDVAGINGTAGLFTFTNAVSAAGKRSIVKSLTIAGIDSAMGYNLFFFSSDLAAPIDGHAAFTLATADWTKFLGVVPIPSTSFFTPALVGIARPPYYSTIRNINLQVQASATANIYAYLVVTETTARTPEEIILIIPYLKVDFEYTD